MSLVRGIPLLFVLKINKPEWKPTSENYIKKMIFRQDYRGGR